MKEMKNSINHLDILLGNFIENYKLFQVIHKLYIQFVFLMVNNYRIIILFLKQ